MVLLTAGLEASAGQLAKAIGATPASDASEMPTLAKLLADTGWQPTPELSGGFHPGDVYAIVDGAHQWQRGACVAADVRVSSYTSIEVVSQLQAGVRLPFFGTKGSLSKSLKFAAPVQESLPGLGLQLTDECVEALRGVRDLSGWYVVQEVLRAEIAEQTCGRVDANGRFSALAQADASLEQACAQESLEPVAVAYRTVPVLPLMPAEALVVAAPRAPLVVETMVNPKPSEPTRDNADVSTRVCDLFARAGGLALKLQGSVGDVRLFWDGARRTGVLGSRTGTGAYVEVSDAGALSLGNDPARLRSMSVSGAASAVPPVYVEVRGWTLDETGALNNAAGRSLRPPEASSRSFALPTDPPAVLTLGYPIASSVDVRSYVLDLDCLPE